MFYNSYVNYSINILWENNMKALWSLQKMAFLSTLIWRKSKSIRSCVHFLSVFFQLCGWLLQHYFWPENLFEHEVTISSARHSSLRMAGKEGGNFCLRWHPFYCCGHEWSVHISLCEGVFVLVQLFLRGCGSVWGNAEQSACEHAELRLVRRCVLSDSQQFFRETLETCSPTCHHLGEQLLCSWWRYCFWIYLLFSSLTQSKEPCFEIDVL